MQLIDTHCHLDFDEFEHDREAVLQRSRANGLKAFVIPAVRRATWESLIALSDQAQDIYYALGLHPLFVDSHDPVHVTDLRRYLEDSQAVAVGEIGLDFSDKSLQFDKQISLFEQQLKLACDVGLPVILHVRKAHDEVLQRLKKFPVVGGIVHAFNGSFQQAELYIQSHFKFGFGGMLTYARSTKLRRLARDLPMDAIVLETDSPDMTVEQHRGERNSPEYLIHCLHSLAEERQMSEKEVALQTTINASQVLGLKLSPS